METEILSKLKNHKNKKVLEFLEPLSCHGDIIERTYEILKGDKEVNFFCPDPQNFRYCFWYLKSSIFAFGSGMQHIGLLLPPDLHNDAISSGAIECREAGTNWYLFPYNHEELTRWVALALAAARDS